MQPIQAETGDAKAILTINCNMGKGSINVRVCVCVCVCVCVRVRKTESSVPFNNAVSCKDSTESVGTK
jgi:hypothetical protein